MCKIIYYRLTCWHHTKPHITPCNAFFLSTTRAGLTKPRCKARTDAENRLVINLASACRECETLAWNERSGWNEKLRRAEKFLAEMKRGGVRSEVLRVVRECVGKLEREHADEEWKVQRTFAPILSRGEGEVGEVWWTRWRERSPDEERYREEREEEVRRWHAEPTNYNFAWWNEESGGGGGEADGEGSAAVGGDGDDIPNEVANDVPNDLANGDAYADEQEEGGEQPEFNGNFFAPGWGPDIDGWTGEGDDGGGGGGGGGGEYAELTLKEAVKRFWEEIRSVDFDVYLEESCALRSAFGK
ncbi:uncharacterized protein EI97DRAFT_441077 [Westerdykella ornata]|uniref:Uncharacterized protein n=1 Tax=Westerdykella ornata TaxID=318751 RepID=A0A6A6JPE3_WESOR|nr:uncharacterized protein EI97DRAFT_441077 [Westerdykella ornata]KAF2277778.1 hypothetical protein EI97DRAFT_441077 [Westerdykella ornata]